MDYLKRDRWHGGPGELHAFIPRARILSLSRPLVFFCRKNASQGNAQKSSCARIRHKNASQLLTADHRPQAQHVIDCGVLPTLVAKVSLLHCFVGNPKNKECCLVQPFFVENQK